MIAEQSDNNRLLPTNDLPEGWKTAKLLDIAEINMGQSPPGKSYNEHGEGLPFFQGKAEFGDRHPTVRVWCSQPKKTARPGDVLISIRAPVGPTNIANSNCAIGRGLAALTPLGGIPTEFILFRLRFLEPELALSGTGSTFTAINRKNLEGIAIDVPPLAEQKRIVEKIEELLARVGKVRECLAKVQAILKSFRQAVLAAACSGRLTADWRETNPTLESMKALLENVQERRLQEANTSSQKQKIDEIYSYQEKGDSESLPESWKYSALDKLCESFQYGTSRKSELSGKVPVLRMGNIQNGEIDWSDLVYTSHEEEVAKYRLAPGDVLFNRTNSPELVGKTAIYKGEHPAIFAGYLIRIRNLDELDSSYLNFCLNTTYAKDYSMRVKTDGVSQSNINAQKLAKFEVPFCPRHEQLEIGRRVKALFKLGVAIERRVATASVRDEKLAQAILSKAFRGELVPTEAELARREGRTYEPASKLVARIKAKSNLEVSGNSLKRKRGARAD
jgi:type I restriction enzyme S subunit